MSPPTTRATVKLVNKEGLHARPSQMIVNLANEYESQIMIRVGGEDADAKSILELMMLASPLGTEMEIEADGSDSETAVGAIVALVERGFGEELA